jgi:hypothetical protein
MAEYAMQRRRGGMQIVSLTGLEGLPRLQNFVHAIPKLKLPNQAPQSQTDGSMVRASDIHLIYIQKVLGSNPRLGIFSVAPILSSLNRGCLGFNMVAPCVHLI